MRLGLDLGVYPRERTSRRANAALRLEALLVLDVDLASYLFPFTCDRRETMVRCSKESGTRQAERRYRGYKIEFPSRQCGVFIRETRQARLSGSLRHLEEPNQSHKSGLTVSHDLDPQ